MIIQEINTIINYQPKSSKILLIIGFLWLLNYLPVQSQDLYDLHSSKKYAEYLLSSGQYDSAAEEFERLIFMDSSNLDFKKNLVLSYRKGGNISTGLNKIRDFSHNDYNNMPVSLSIEYMALLIGSGDTQKAGNFIESSHSISDIDKSIIKSCVLLLNHDYKTAQQITAYSKSTYNNFPGELMDITESAKNLKFKSPAIAGVLSGIVPGTGKVYTHNYIDALISFVFIGSNAWQSYKGFEKNGIKSVSGWIFGGLSLGFYVGNIYGSVKAAKKYNKKIFDEKNKEVYNFLQYYNF
jgi:tetratricopeptide (TPR) repeat protein